MATPFNKTVIIPSVTYDPLLEMPICSSFMCGHAVEYDGLRRHLSQVHKISNEQVQTVVDDVDQQRVTKQRITNNRLRDAYMATQNKSYKSEQPLPLHPMLVTVKALKCSTCHQVFKDTKKNRSRHRCTAKENNDNTEVPPASSAAHALIQKEKNNKIP
ncbi:MAG: hypothetical protein AAGC43_18355, partial [Bacteroidota bacterium]